MRGELITAVDALSRRSWFEAARDLSSRSVSLAGPGCQIGKPQRG